MKSARLLENIFPKFQHQFGPLAEKLDSLDLPGSDMIRSLNQELADILLTDASDAPQRLGSEESPFYDGLKWAGEVDRALKNGLEQTVRELQQHRRDIDAMPDTGVPGKLRQDLADELIQMSQQLDHEDFHAHIADLNSMLTSIKAQTRDAAVDMALEQRDRLKTAEQELQKLPGWVELSQEERSTVLAQVDELALEAQEDLNGLKTLLSREYIIHSQLQDIRKRIEDVAAQRAQEREKEKAGTRPCRRCLDQRGLNPISYQINYSPELVAEILRVAEIRSPQV